MVKCIYCGMCEVLPGRRHRRGPNFEFATETRAELYYNRRLLAGERRWEREIAANLAADAAYR